MRILIGISIAGLLACAVMVVDSLLPGPLRLGDWTVGAVYLTALPLAFCTAFVIWRRGFYDFRWMSREVSRALPAWIRRGVVVIGVAAAVHFVYFTSTAREGGAERTSDGYAITSHGTFVRSISEDEYLARIKLERRGMLGHVVFMYAVAGAGAVGLRRHEKNAQ